MEFKIKINNKRDYIKVLKHLFKKNIFWLNNKKNLHLEYFEECVKRLGYILLVIEDKNIFFSSLGDNDHYCKNYTLINIEQLLNNKTETDKQISIITNIPKRTISRWKKYPINNYKRILYEYLKSKKYYELCNDINLIKDNLCK